MPNNNWRALLALSLRLVEEAEAQYLKKEANQEVTS